MMILLKTFYRDPLPHEMGITCSINNLEYDALFDPINSTPQTGFNGQNP